MMLGVSDLVRNLSGDALDRPNCGVLVGLNFAPNITNHTLRFKASRAIRKLLLASERELLDDDSKDKLLESYKEAICEAVNSDDVVGDIPNFPANRINANLIFRRHPTLLFSRRWIGLKKFTIGD